MGKKKKRGAPERPCPACGKSYHPRRKECPHCGVASPPAAKKGTKRSVAKRAAAKPARSGGGSNTLDVAIRFVESAGSLKEAKAALDKIERIKGL
jgi:ribosomal protein L37E